MPPPHGSNFIVNQKGYRQHPAFAQADYGTRNLNAGLQGSRTRVAPMPMRVGRDWAAATGNHRHVSSGSAISSNPYSLPLVSAGHQSGVARALRGVPPRFSQIPVVEPTPTPTAAPGVERPTRAHVGLYILSGDSERQHNFNRTVKIWITGGKVRNVELHIITVSPISRMPTTKIMAVGSRNINTDGILIKSFATLGDALIFCKYNGNKSTATQSMRVKASLDGADYGDKISLSMVDRRVKLRTGDKKIKAKLDIGKNLVAFVKEMVELRLPNSDVVNGTKIPERKLRDTTEVVVEAIAELKYSSAILHEALRAISGFSPVVAGVSGVYNLGFAARCGVRVYRLGDTLDRIDKYPEIRDNTKEGRALFGRLRSHYADESIGRIKSAVKSFIEAGLIGVFPGSSVVSLGFAIDRFLVQVFARIREKREVELTNLMLEEAKEANSADAFYEIIATGHIIVPAYVVGEYSSKDLSAARRIYVGLAEDAKKLRDRTAYLKRRAAEITEASRFEVINEGNH